MLGNYYKLARESIRSSKWRSLLTMLGIIIGVVSVITIVSIGEGVKRQVSHQISDFGSDLIIIRPGQTVNRDNSGNVVGLNLFNTFNGTGVLTDNDVKIVTKTAGVKLMAPLATVNGVPSYDGQRFNDGLVIATNQNLPDLLNHDTEFGEFLTTRDEGKDFAVIGQQVAEELFKENVPIGKAIDFRGQRFIVKGVFKKFDATTYAAGADLNKAIFIPYVTGQKINQGSSQVFQILVKPETTDQAKTVQSSIESALTEAHGGQQDFTVLGQDETLAVTNNVLTVLTGLVAAVATISLVVGGIGVMNIMLVSVTERTHEIGIRKAVGATNRQILSQFLVEAIVLSLAGGIIGVLVSVVLNFVLRITTNLEPVISVPVMIIAVFVSFVVGVVFGVTPAIKAARKHPIDALRFE